MKERIDSKRKDRIKSKVWQPTGTEIQDPNVISMVGAIVKKMEIRNASIKTMKQDHTEQMKKATDKIFELELKISNYETGYIAPRTVKIEGNQSNHFQSYSNWNASWNPENAKSNQKKSSLELDPQIIEEIGVEGAKK